MSSARTSGSNLLEPSNLSSSLKEFQRHISEATTIDSDLSLLKMTICNDHSHAVATAAASSSSIGATTNFNNIGHRLDVVEASLGAQLTFAYNNHHPSSHLLLLQQQQQQQLQQQLQHQHHHHMNITEISKSSPLTKVMFDHFFEPMQSIDNKLDYYFSDIWIKNGDERTSKLPFMSAGPWKLIYATLVYLYLIKWFLPKLMQKFQALELNWCIRSYNLLMVLSNMYAFYHGARILAWGSKCFGCEVINHRDYSPQSMELLHYGWIFLLSRLIEWLDTIFFVLRKKERQVTKLHVFHHSFVPLLCWTYLKFHPGYTVAFFPFVNTFVHTIMYTYYFLATFGPSVQPYLWWKKYLTSLQIAQFVLILIQLATIPLSSNEKCQYPRGFLYVAFAGAILFLWLFYTYYIDTYKTTKKPPRLESQKLATAARSNSNNTNTTTTTTSNRNGSSWSFGLPKQQVSTFSLKTRQQPREGSSRSLSESIDNAIDNSFYAEQLQHQQLQKVKKQTNSRREKLAD